MRKIIDMASDAGWLVITGLGSLFIVLLPAICVFAIIFGLVLAVSLAWKLGMSL